MEAMDTRAQLKSLIGQAEALRVKNEKAGQWNAEDATEYEKILGQADKAKTILLLTEKADEIKAWAGESAGSAVRDGWRSAAPLEGTAPGVTANDGGGMEMYATSALGDQKLAVLKSGAYKDAFIDYLRTVGKFGRMDAIKASSMKVLSEGTDTAGGFWVPPDIRADVIKKIATIAMIRPNAFAFTTGSDIVSFPKVVYTTDDKYTSGVRFSWTAEAPAADISEATNPVAGRVNIPVHTATAAIILTRAVMEDAQFDLLGYITMLLGEAFGLGEDDAFITGTGIGQPQGFTAHANAATAHNFTTFSSGMYVPSGSAGAVTWGLTSTAGATVGQTGIVGTEAALAPQYEANAKWYANKATYAALRALTDSQTRPLWNPTDAWPNAANGMAANLLGYPVVKDQFMPTIAANALPIAFGDMGGYYIADRVGLSVEVLRELRALRDEVIVYARKRVGGQLVHDWKLKLMKCSAS